MQQQGSVMSASSTPAISACSAVQCGRGGGHMQQWGGVSASFTQAVQCRAGRRGGGGSSGGGGAHPC